MKKDDYEWWVGEDFGGDSCDIYQGVVATSVWK
jgi:hypothetical protein